MRGGLLGVGLLLAAIGGAVPLPASAQPDPVRTAENVARSLGLQVTLPGAEGLSTPKTDSEAPVPEARTATRFTFDASNVLRVILYAAIGIGILFALWTMRDRLPAFGRGRLTVRDETPARPADPAIARMVEAQIEADDVARRGQLAEAMHVLLLRSLNEVRRRLNVSFADSLTSREILEALSLPEIGKRALADIVRRVEQVYFGNREADADDYSACRGSYEQLLQAMRAGPA